MIIVTQDKKLAPFAGAGREERMREMTSGHFLAVRLHRAGASGPAGLHGVSWMLVPGNKIADCSPRTEKHLTKQHLLKDCGMEFSRYW